MPQFQEDNDWCNYQKKIAQIYDRQNYEPSLASYALNASHSFLEKKFDSSKFFTKVLEVGAGSGKHLHYVKHGFEEYVLSDSNPNMIKLAEENAPNKHRGLLSFEVIQAEALPYEDNCFDRLIAAHVLEHMYSPHLVLKEWVRVLKPGGTLSVLIPTDPGIAWRIGRYLGPRGKALKMGFPYDYIMAREHVNSCNSLIALLRYYFPKRHECWWPLLIPSIDLNLFFVCNAILKN